MATERTRIYAQRIGDDWLEVYAQDYTEVRSSGGFNRLAYVKRYEYRLNGKRVSRAVWMATKRAYSVSAYTVADPLRGWREIEAGGNG